ncbi:MAG: urease subunit beta [Candidatus Bathyarchaeia archaeon]
METREANPGEIVYAKDPIVINRGRKVVELLVKNTGDRPIQVGSHFHFFEVNKALEFDRAKTFGTRLNIQAGTSVRFEPGDEKQVSLVQFGGKQVIWGFNAITQGNIKSASVRRRALLKAKKMGFKGA